MGVFLMDVSEIRLRNLQNLARQYGSQRKLADAVDTSPAYISQILNKILANGRPRSIGNDFARKIEQKLALGHGWMDTPHDKTLMQESLELDGMSMSMESMQISTEKPITKRSTPIANTRLKNTDPHLLLAHEQGRAESLKTICMLLIKHDPEYAKQLLESFTQSDLINEKVSGHIQGAPDLEKNYAQTVLAAWSSTGKELMAFAQSLTTQQ